MVGKPKSAEMHPGPGFRIRTEIERPSPETVAAFHAFDTPSISDMMNGRKRARNSQDLWTGVSRDFLIAARGRARGPNARTA